MASLFQRGNIVWLRHKSKEGKWVNETTGYRANNPIERRNAEKVRAAASLKERIETPAVARGGWEWVAPWIAQRWSGGTGSAYARHWRKIEEWLAAKDLPNPANVQREHALGYKAWRIARDGVIENTAILEAKFLGQVMEEAVNQKRCISNPARKLGLKRQAVEGKRAWTDEELALVDSELQKPEHRFGWMRVTFLLGRYQAARIGSCNVPLRCIHIDTDPKCSTIRYESPKGGADKAYTQPLDERLKPILSEIIEHRKAIGSKTLCDLPGFTKAKKHSDGPSSSASLEWREFLDRLGIHGVSHHDLRRTWVTKAALSGNISEAIACRFTNHSSIMVHRIYLALQIGDMADMLERLGS